jgi:cell division protein FtsB
MNWRQLIWVATVIAIWIVSLMIVDSAAKQTRMGYKQQELNHAIQTLEESNLRLKCEISVLHDLERAEQFSESRQMIYPDHQTFTFFLPSDESD